MIKWPEERFPWVQLRSMHGLSDGVQGVILLFYLYQIAAFAIPRGEEND